MRLRPLALSLALVAGLVSTASAGDPAGRVYLGSDTASLVSLVEGLGYEPKMAGEVVVFEVVRPEGSGRSFAVQVRILVSKNGSKLQIVAPLYRWARPLEAVETSRLFDLLAKSFEFSPTRFWLSDAGKGLADVGLQRTLDNRAVRPQDVREQIDALYAAASATRALWDEELWK